MNSSSLLEQCQDCGVWMEMQGSDHAPVWADWSLAGPLPTPEAAPPLSTRYMFTGVHTHMHAYTHMQMYAQTYMCTCCIEVINSGSARELSVGS